MPRKQRTPLVCQYAENLSSAVMEKYPALIRQYVHGRNGIYALYRKSRLYYVGLASNMRSRLKHHLRDRHAGKWNNFSFYLTIGDSHMKELESLLLRIVTPKGNKQKGKFARCENLRGRLKKEIRAQQRQEAEDLLNGHSNAHRPRRSRERREPVYFRTRKLKGYHKDEVVSARVLKSGEISIQGKRFASLSRAARAVVGHGVNGWWFWHYERAPGDWVRLVELRG